jgi:hypothetical protein
MRNAGKQESRKAGSLIFLPSSSNSSEKPAMRSVAGLSSLQEGVSPVAKTCFHGEAFTVNDLRQMQVEPTKSFLSQALNGAPADSSRIRDEPSPARFGGLSSSCCAYTLRRCASASFALFAAKHSGLSGRLREKMTGLAGGVR